MDSVDSQSSGDLSASMVKVSAAAHKELDDAFDSDIEEFNKSTKILIIESISGP